ncbi:hypothetical protein FRC04_007803 [Tulasnella sp. 424]|nr:hypothetical protein FRC04_007803 [Tulasnella sp. 424]
MSRQPTGKGIEFGQTQQAPSAKTGAGPLTLAEKKRNAVPVGIIGAGVGGLYAALILQSLGIPCEILEASERVGGRVFTHRFSTQKYDYFDVGAMRFPDEPTMNRLFHLLRCRQLNSNDLEIASSLIKFYSEADSKNSFLDFNGYSTRVAQADGDPFDFFATGVPKEDIEKGVDGILHEALTPLVCVVKKAISTPSDGENGLKEVIKLDKHSFRTYLSWERGLSTPTINWCETIASPARFYNFSLSEMVLDSIAFGGSETNWYCLDGGCEILTRGMAKFLDDSSPGTVQRCKVVKAIRAVASNHLELAIDGETDPRLYCHVISTIPPPVLRTLDLDSAGFSVNQRNALRQVSYMPGVKVGVKFKSQWWKNWCGNGGEPLNIMGGQSFTDRCDPFVRTTEELKRIRDCVISMIRLVVYPSYGLQEPDITTVLIASYTWTADAASLGSLINSGERANMRLKTIILRDLARVHNVPLSMLEEQYVDHFAYNWQHNPFAQGKYLGGSPFFRPGEFESLYPSLLAPAADGYLYLAGDTLSLQHGWIVGALKASWRAVKSVLSTSYPDRLPEFFDRWGGDMEGTTLDLRLP